MRQSKISYLMANDDVIIFVTKRLPDFSVRASVFGKIFLKKKNKFGDRNAKIQDDDGVSKKFGNS